MSFTTAAISAMRANTPQYPSSANKPRATYSSSYERDYADVQRYKEFLKGQASEWKDQESSKKQPSKNATNNRPGNNYNILSHQRDPRDDRTYDDDNSRPTQPQKKYEPTRAPYAYDDDGRETKKPSGTGKEFDASISPTYQNPSRYRSTAQDSYIRPDESLIASKLPPPPSKAASRPGSAAQVSSVNAPWASHNDQQDNEDKGESKKRAQAATTAGAPASKPVPGLALNKVPKAAFEPYATVDPEPTITRFEREEQQARDKAQEDREADDADWRWQNTQKLRQQAREEAQALDRQRWQEERERGYDQEPNPAPKYHRPLAGASTYEQEYERDTSFDDERADRDAYHASPDSRGPEEFGRLRAFKPHHEQSSYGRPSYDEPAPTRGGQQQQQPSRYSDEADEVSQPMSQLNVKRQDSRGSRYEDEDRDERNARRSKNDDGDRHRKSYQDGAADRDEDDHRDDRRRAAEQRQSKGKFQDPRPSSSGGYTRAAPPTPAYADQAAGRSSGLTAEQQRARAHQPLWGPHDGSQSERPRKKMVPGYESYIEKSSRTPTKRVGPVAHDPDAAGARLSRAASNKYGHLESGWSLGDVPVSSNDEPQQRRGTSNRSHPNESIYERNPILQDSSRYDPRPGSFQHHHGHGTGTDSSRLGPGSSGVSGQRETWSSDTAPRSRHPNAMHPSVESQDMEQVSFGRTDLQPAGRRDAKQGFHQDRGIKPIGNASYAHSNIFGNLDTKYQTDASSNTTSNKTQSGLRVNQDRNASHDLLSEKNLLYTRPVESDWNRGSGAGGDLDARSNISVPHERGYLQSSVTSGYKGDQPYTPRSEALPYNPTPRIQRSPEQQRERDAYESELRRLHAEQAQISARGTDYRKQGKGYESTRLW